MLSRRYRLADVDRWGQFAAFVLVVIVTLVAEYLMTLVENRLAKWRPQQSLDTN